MKRLEVNLYYSYKPEFFENLVLWLSDENGLLNFNEYTHQSDHLNRAELLNELSHKSILTRGVSGNNLTNSEIMSIGLNNRDYKLMFMSVIKEVENDDSSAINAIQAEVLKLISVDNFICGFIYDSEFVKWQSERRYDEYRKRMFDMSRLNIVRNQYDEIEVDISNNWGKSVFVLGMNFQVAWKMYFGKLFYSSFVGKDKLLNFKSDYSKVETLDGVIIIQLYDDPFNSSNPENYQNLRKFREWIGLDQLIEEWLNQYKRFGYNWLGS